MKNKYKYLILFIGICLFFNEFIFGTYNNSNVQNIKPKIQSDYSDELQHETYTPIQTVSNWYDGHMTFWYDTIGQQPKEMLVSLVGSASATIQNSGHSNTLQLSDDSDLKSATAKWFYQGINIPTSSSDIFHIEFYAKVQSGNSMLSIWLTNEIRKNTLFFNSQTNQIGYIDVYGNTYYIYSYSTNVWYHFRLRIQGAYSFNHEIRIDINKVFISAFEFPKQKEINNITFSTKQCTRIDISQETWGLTANIDAIGIQYFDYIGGSVWNPIINLPTQIQSLKYYSFLNYYALDSSKIFSLYSTFVDKYPIVDNNYRTFFLSDKILNNQLLDKQRLIRLSSATSDRKLKVIQLLFENFNDSNSFCNDLNQSIYIRIDTFDTSNNLINKFYVSLDFNQSDGLLEWFALYRKSLSEPVWLETPTNPIINFADYLDGLNMSELQVNFQFYLTYTNSTQMYLLIRTDLCFNNRYDLIYSYDKVINAGNSAFYASQTKLQVQYIDYFNRNNYTEVIESEFEPDKYINYTFNNLRGIRTLQLNSTNWKYNFLDIGFFKTDLDYYTPPAPPEPPAQPEPDLEPDLPSSHYWSYQSFSVRQSTESNTVSKSQTVDFYNESVDCEFEYDYYLLEGHSYTAKYPYEPEAIKRKNLPNYLEFKTSALKIEFKIPIGWFMDIVCLVFNTGVLFFDYLGYLSTVAWNYLFMFLFVYLLIPFLYNYPLFWLVVLGVNILFYLYVLLVFLIGWLWYFIRWIYENIIIPFVEWLYEVVLPWCVEFGLFIITSVISLAIWFSTGCQANYNDIYDSVYVIVSEVFDFLLETTITIIQNIPQLIAYLIIYIWLLLFFYVKELYTEYKGFVNRKNQLTLSREGYQKPITWTKNGIITVKEILARWT